MTFLKLLLLLLIAFPFALFLLYIVDRLMDDLPVVNRHKSEPERGHASGTATRRKRKELKIKK